MNGAAFVSSMILAVIFTTATVQASPVAYQKEAITENNLPVFYPQLKQQMNYQSSWLAGKYTDFALWRSCQRRMKS
ncbi:hydrolase, partial [Yersinia pestis subsp. pestis]|nr:hydrolase [Yersinia pestis subsp. pestis]